jgi:hypothetical protein
MEMDFRPSELFSDPLRIVAMIGGFLLGLKLSFDAGSLIAVLLGAFSVGLAFTLLAVILEDLRSGDLREAGKIFGLLLLLFVGGTVFFLQDGVNCMMAVHSVDYNSLDDSCEVNTYTCNVDRPWYMSECSGENLEDFCERKSFGNSGVNEQDLNEEELRRQQINEARREAGLGTGYRACKEAGFVE